MHIVLEGNLKNTNLYLKMANNTIRLENLGQTKHLKNMYRMNILIL